MAIQELFPLGIYVERLADYAEHNRLMKDHIYALRESSGKKRTSRRSSWTGDIHGIDTIHFDPAFSWLTDQLERHVIAYLTELGLDLDKMDVHIQRSWPIIGTKGQAVKKHAHNTAHLSAVYYISVPKNGKKSGKISFYNDARPNEFSPGLGSSMTGAYSSFNDFNYKHASFTPREGRLILFPAKTNHAVAQNETNEDRLSLSFDIVVTSRGDLVGQDEFLMPTPAKWKTIEIPGRPSQTTFTAANKNAHPSNSAHSNVKDKTLLTSVTQFYRSVDRYMLAEKDNHVLWETRRFPHVSSRAAGRRYDMRITRISDNRWRPIGGQSRLVCEKGNDWSVRDNAADRLYCYLRERNVSADGATLSRPQIERLTNHTEPSDLSRSAHHLCVYVRLDHVLDETVFIAFADGSRVEMEPGDLVFASGLRRHSLGGTGHVLSFYVNVPSVGRTDVFSAAEYCDIKTDDGIIFAWVTAEPLHATLPPIDKIASKLKRHASLKRRKFRRGACPVINKFLIQSSDPASANAEELAIIDAYGRKEPAKPGDEPVILEDVDVLSKTECTELLAYASDHMTSVVPDTVDELPEYQVDMRLKDLVKIVGEETAEAVFRLPELLGATPGIPVKELAKNTSLFIRKYSPDTRSNIAFHADNYKRTVNIALNDADEFDGGVLLAKSGDHLKRLSRKTGKAVLHAGNVVHGVTQITKGMRWTLILFYSGPISEPARNDSVAALQQE